MPDVHDLVQRARDNLDFLDDNYSAFSEHDICARLSNVVDDINRARYHLVDNDHQ